MHESDAFKKRWWQLTLAEQLGNIGSEVSRASRWKEKDDTKFWGAAERGMRLFDCTLEDPRWHSGRIREIVRARELFGDAILGGGEYGATLTDVQRYCDTFALAARRHT